MNRLADLLEQGESLVTPGVFDGLSARLAERAGFPLAFLSGSAMSYAQLARPDVGLLSLTDVALTLDKICDRVGIPIVVDVDSGFGNAINVDRTVRALERAGAAGVQIEDQQSTKRVQDVLARPLVSTAEMVGKIKAGLDARQKNTTLISARTDAMYTQGIDAAIDRARQYLEAGADLIFIEGVGEREHLTQIRSQFEPRVPLIYNCESGVRQTPMSGEELSRLGYQVQLHPGIVLRAMAAGGAEALGRLAAQAGKPPTDDDGSLAEIVQSDLFLSRFRGTQAPQE